MLPIERHLSFLIDYQQLLTPIALLSLNMGRFKKSAPTMSSCASVAVTMNYIKCKTYNKLRSSFNRIYLNSSLYGTFIKRRVFYIENVYGRTIFHDESIYIKIHST